MSAPDVVWAGAGRSHSLGRTLAAYAALTRAGTVVAGTALTLIGAHLAGPVPSPARLAAMTVAVALAIAFAQVVNDVLDLPVDRLHKPHRPLVAGTVTVRSAGALARALAAGALLAGAAAGPVGLLSTAGLLAASWAYSRWWKDTVLLGNAAVAFLASTPVTLGAAAAGGVTSLVLAAQATVAVFMTAFEVVKTGRDRGADGAAGFRTIATRHGARTTALLGAALCLAFAVTTAVPALLAPRPGAYVGVMGAGAVLPALVAAALLVRRAGAADPFSRPFALLRLAWFAGVASLVLL